LVNWDIAGVYDDQGKHEKALEKYEEALGVLIGAVGLDHHELARLRCHMSLCQQNLGDTEGAIESMRESHRIFSKLGMTKDAADSARLISKMQRNQDAADAAEEMMMLEGRG